MYVPRRYRAVQRLIRMHYVVCDVYRLYEFYDIFQTMVCAKLLEARYAAIAQTSGFRDMSQCLVAHHLLGLHLAFSSLPTVRSAALAGDLVEVAAVDDTAHVLHTHDTVFGPDDKVCREP